MSKTKLAKVGITAPNTIGDIADFYKLEPSTVWRVAVGETDFTKAPNGVLRSLLQAGWEPKDGKADVLAHLNKHATIAPLRGLRRRNSL